MSSCYSQGRVYKYKPVHREQLKEYRYPSTLDLINQEPAPIHEEEGQAASVEIPGHGRHESAISSQSIVHYQPGGHEEYQSQESYVGHNEPSIPYKHYYQGHEQIKHEQGGNIKYIQSLRHPAVSHEVSSAQSPARDEAHYIRVPAHNYQYIQESEHQAPSHHQVEAQHQIESHSHDEPIDYYVS